MTRSIRNFLATHNLLAVSAMQQEVAMNTEQALDTTLLVDLNTVLNYQALKNPNREELTGKEEADRLHDFGGKVVGAISSVRLGFCMSVILLVPRVVGVIIQNPSLILDVDA